MKFFNFNSTRLFPTLLLLAALSCKKDVSFNSPNSVNDNVRMPIRQFYSDSSIGFCDFYQIRDSAYEAGNMRNFYNLSTTGSGTKMPYAKVFSSFEVYSGTNSTLGQGVSLNAFFEKELQWDNLIGVPNNVNHLIYDYNGNAVWFKIDSLTLLNKSSSMVQFTGSSSIVGGTGIYVRAKGQLSLQIKIDLKEPGKNIIKQQGYMEL